MKIPFCKIGSFTSSNGIQKSFDAAALDNIVSAYNGQQDHEAPLCIGLHPPTNGPAYGWVKSISRDKNILFAEADPNTPEVEDWVKKGFFKKVSPSFYEDGKLRHIALLGAAPPAIKGLPAISFSEDNAIELTFDFSESWMWDSVRRLFQGLRDFIIEQKDVASADVVIPQWNIDNLTPPPEQTNSIDNNFSDNTKETDMAATEELQTKLTAQEAENARISAELAALKNTQRKNEFTQFCESPEMRERITPAMRTNVVELLTAIDTETTFDFSESDGTNTTTKKKTPVDAFKDILKTLPKVVSFSETAVNGAEPAEQQATGDRIAGIANKKTNKSE